MQTELTTAGMASSVASKRVGRGKGVPEEASRPASPGQKRRWVLSQLAPAAGTGMVAATVPISGALDVDRLTEAVRAVLRDHPILRATFRMEQGEVVWVPGLPPEPRWVDLSTRPEADRSAAIEKWRSDALTAEVDLSSGPLMAVAIFRLTPTEHVLAISAHQSVCDRTAVGLMIEEVADSYSDRTELRRGGLTRPVPMNDPYSALLEEQRDFIASPAAESHLMYWRDVLRGELPPLELPEAASGPSDAVQPGEASARTWQPAVMRLGSASAQAAAALAAIQGATVDSVLLAAFLVILGRLSGQEDLVVGLTHDGRATVASERLIGSLDDQVVLRTRLDDDPTFGGLLARVRDVRSEALAHRQIPLARVIDELSHGAQRKGGQAPLFRAAFAHHEVPGQGLTFGTAMAGPVDVVQTYVEDVALEVLSGPQDLPIELRSYSGVDGLDWAARQRLLNRLALILDAALAEPQARISRLPLLDPTERRQILDEWNSTEASYPADLLVHQLFEAQVRRRPQAVAVSGKGFSLTYAQLDAAADRLAARLRAMGVGPEVRVGVLLDRTADMLASVLAVLKTGAAYVPLDPAYPADRIEYMLSDSEAPVLITQSWLLDRATGFYGQMLCVDQPSDEPTSPPPAADVKPAAARPDNAAYVIYTSGSTGKPKGVEVLHRGVVNFLNSMAKEPGFAADDVMLAITTLCFDIAGLELFLPLSVGGRIVLVERGTASDGLALAQFLRTCNATVMQATPATWRMLIEAGWQGGGPLKRVLTGGEALAPDLAARLLERSPEVWNVYGPTETTIWSTVMRVETAPQGNARVPIGRPIDNTCCYVLDRHSQPVPAGVAGELYIGGHGVARGYLKRPELTAERFVADPYSPELGARMYRTGDVVRYRPDGTLEYLSRSDHQVKIRGHRIELGEIEAELLRMPDVQAAVVVAREDPPQPKRLVAYVVLRSSSTGANESADDAAVSQRLRALLRDRLPEYMVPAAVVTLGALPLTPNGKIDRKALPPPEIVDHVAPDYVAPSGQLEEQLSEMFARALGVSRVGVTDSFFDLGGDSIRAVSLAVMMQDVFKINISLTDLFGAPTVRQMAGFVRGDQARSTIDGAPIAPVTLRPGDHDVPPLFYFPGAGGYSFEFRVIATELPPGRTVYGFNLPVAGEPGWRPRYTVQELAADMTKAVRAMQPNGPYLLCGYSFGGFLALEVARLLREQGAEPALLLILDTWAPGFPHKITGLKNLALHTRNMISGGGFDYMAGRLRNIQKRVLRKIRWTARRWRGSGMLTPGEQGPASPAPVQERIAGALDTALQAEAEYDPAPYHGGMTLFRATIMPEWPACSFEDPTNGWSAHVRGPIEIHRFPCEHLGMFMSEARGEIVAQLHQCMEAAVEGSRTRRQEPAHS